MPFTEEHDGSAGVDGRVLLGQLCLQQQPEGEAQAVEQQSHGAQHPAPVATAVGGCCMVSSWARCSGSLVRQWHTLVETQQQQAGQRRERSGDLCGSHHALQLQRFHPHHDGDEEGEHRREVDEGYGEGGGGVLPAIEGVLRERRAKHGAEEEVRQDLQCELGPRAPFFEKGYWSKEDVSDQAGG